MFIILSKSGCVNRITGRKSPIAQYAPQGLSPTDLHGPYRVCIIRL